MKVQKKNYVGGGDRSGRMSKVEFMRESTMELHFGLLASKVKYLCVLETSQCLVGDK